MPTTSDRFKGAIVGLAVGDALGGPLEYSTSGKYNSSTQQFILGPNNGMPVTEFMQNINYQLRDGGFLRPGQWTDDTALALCLAMSLIEKKGFDAKDQLTKYQKYYEEGYMSPVEYCFDIGMTTKDAINQFNKFGRTEAMPTILGNSSNGALMRLAPVPLFYSENPELAIHLSGESSKTTHNSSDSIDACKYFGGLLVGAVMPQPKLKILSECYSPIEGYWNENKMDERVRDIAEGSFKTKNPPEIVSDGSVEKSLEAALWAFYNSNNFRDGAILAVNLGGDADTVGAIYGQIAGAHYGISVIPREWQRAIQKSPWNQQFDKLVIENRNGRVEMDLNLENIAYALLNKKFNDRVKFKDW